MKKDTLKTMREVKPSQKSYYTDTHRAEEVFDRLIEMLREDKHPFDHSEPPQVVGNMPINLDMKKERKMLALYLWASCYYMRGGIDSLVAFRRLTLIYERKKYLYDPEWFLANVDPAIVDGTIPYGPELIAKLMDGAVYKELSKELGAHGLGFSLKENTRFWILNAVKLAKFWGSDPLNLFAGVGVYDDLVANIANKKQFLLTNKQGFLGFQEKMVSMIAYFLASTNLVDLAKIPVPVDFHVLRMMISTEIIKPAWKVKMGEDIFSPALLAVARDVSFTYCVRRGIEMIELCDALWLYSRAMCSWHPDTRSRTPQKSKKRKAQQMLRTDERRKKLEESIAGDRPPDEIKVSADLETAANMRIGRDAKIIHLKADWGNLSHVERYDRACSLCAVEHLCTKVVPAAPYYSGGIVVARPRSKLTHEGRFMFRVADMSIKIVRKPWDKEASRRLALEFLGEVIQEEPKSQSAESQEPTLVDGEFGLALEEVKKKRRLVKLPRKKKAQPEPVAA